jgi:DNA-binding HxlR family transcriptional regulator
MLSRTYDDQVCSIARTLEVLGERWTLLIVRDALQGLRRFDDFQNSLGVARNVLTDRLKRLVEAGVLERVPYQQRPQRFEYQLTDMGCELAVPVIGLMHWGGPAPGRAGRSAMSDPAPRLWRRAAQRPGVRQLRPAGTCSRHRGAPGPGATAARPV